MKYMLNVLGCFILLSGHGMCEGTEYRRINDFEVQIKSDGDQFSVSLSSRKTGAGAESSIVAQRLKLYAISDKLLIYYCFSGTYFSCSSMIYDHKGDLLLNRAGDLLDFRKHYLLTSETFFEYTDGDDFIRKTYVLTDVDTASYHVVNFVKIFDPKCGLPSITAEKIQSANRVLITTQDKCKKQTTAAQ